MDLIYRDTARRIIESPRSKEQMLTVLSSIPSVQPKKGKWEITNLGAVGAFDSCSECKRVVKHKAPFYNFCPNCGADMREPEDIPMEYFESGGR